MNEASKRGSWNLDQSRAEIHEQYLVPAVYAQWANQLTRLAEIDAGFSVLDVGCATGVLARMASEEVGFGGTVVGVDKDPEMLAVAARKSRAVDWREADAANLPYQDGAFDRVMSQFMLPHVDNRVAVTREMWRLVCNGGRLVIAVWAPLYSAPAFQTLVDLVRDFGHAASARDMALPWELGFDNKLATILETAGVRSYEIRDVRGTARFPGPSEMLDTWLGVATLRGALESTRHGALKRAASEQLASFRVPGGDIVCPLNARIVSATKSA